MKLKLDYYYLGSGDNVGMTQGKPFLHEDLQATTST